MVVSDILALRLKKIFLSSHGISHKNGKFWNNVDGRQEDVETEQTSETIVLKHIF